MQKESRDAGKLMSMSRHPLGRREIGRSGYQTRNPGYHSVLRDKAAVPTRTKVIRRPGALTGTKRTENCNQKGPAIARGQAATCGEGCKTREVLCLAY